MLHSKSSVSNSADRKLTESSLWAIKFSVSMFLRTLTESVWQRSHQRYLRYLHIFLAVTFVATIVADLGACQPFTHYWQVVPDPGPQCRQGSTYLLTMSILNISTNLALILFPVPMILKSRLPIKRYFLLILIEFKILIENRQASIVGRLALPILSIGFTAYAMSIIIDRHFAQPIRSLLASFDILLATFISNATVLVSLLQDRGYKKTKYKHGTEREGFNTTFKSAGIKGGLGEGVGRVRHERWGSDEDLMRSESDDASLRKKGDGTMVSVESIGMKDLRRDDSLRGERRERSKDRALPGVPGKVKLKEIRVATTWDIRVEDSEV